MRALPGVAALLGIVALIASCGGGGGLDDPDELARKAFEAMNRDGMVVHVKGDDGSEVWIDARNRLYKGLEQQGEVTLLSVGSGWEQTSYDPFENAVTTVDRSPTGDRPRIDDPVIQWLEPLGALAYGSQLTAVGRTTSDGREVIVIEARSPVVENGVATGRELVGRVELDSDSYLLIAFDRRVDVPLDQRNQTPDPGSLDLGDQQPKHVVYTIEFVARSDLPDDFFTSKDVEDQIITLEEKLQQAVDLGIPPFWLGEQYEGSLGDLRLPAGVESVFVEEAKGEISFHYLLEISGLGPAGLIGESVVVRVGKPGVISFGPPPLQEFAGELPEGTRETTARGLPVTVYTSILTPDALPCPAEACPPSDAPIYHRLQITIGDSAIQIETSARVDDTGADRNEYNTQAGIVALAEALRPAP